MELEKRFIVLIVYPFKTFLYFNYLLVIVVVSVVVSVVIVVVSVVMSVVTVVVSVVAALVDAPDLPREKVRLDQNF